MCYLDQKEQRGQTDYSPEKIHYLLQRVAFVQLKGGQNYRLNHLSKVTHVVCEYMEDIHWSHNVTKSELDWFDKLFNIYFILTVGCCYSSVRSKAACQMFYRSHTTCGAMNF